MASYPFNPSLEKNPNQSPPKLLTVFFQSYLTQRDCPQVFTMLFFPFHFSSFAMISAQQPPFPSRIQRVMDCQTEEEETCEEQYDPENCTCSSKRASSTAESDSGLIQFKYRNCHGMLAFHTFTFLSLQVVDVTVSLPFDLCIFPPPFPLMFVFIIRPNLQKGLSL